MKKIQISQDLLRTLEKRKLHHNYTYEDVLWDLLEDNMELSEETKKNILQSKREIKEGKTKSFEQMSKDSICSAV